MPPVKALVVGAGISGLATCLSLQQQGVDVDLVERRAEVEALGSGITLIGPALRALQMLGVYDSGIAQGFGISDFQTYDVDGTLASTFRLPSPVGTNQPGMLGTMRPTLHSILLQQVKQQGTSIRTGVSPTGIADGESSTTVTFDSGECNEYDLVVGATASGRLCASWSSGPCRRSSPGRPLCGWCSHARARSLPRSSSTLSTTSSSASPRQPQTACTCTARSRLIRTRPSPTEVLALTRETTAPFGGLVERIRKDIIDPGQNNLAKFETVIVPSPWSHGRIVIVGDAAHCPPPQLAAGAAMCLQGAVALGQELQRATGPEQALQNFAARRYERCAFVVHTGRQLSHWQTYPGTGGNDHERVTAEAFELLAQPF